MVETPIHAGALRRAATRRLGQAGVADPAREARWLWAAASGGELGAWQETEAAVSEGVQQAFASLLERRLAGEPLAHVTGLIGFRHLTLRSDRRALIPRPETEGLIDLLLDRVERGVAADLGTGTGCIALSLADEGNFERVIAVDRSKEAVGLARENRSRTGLAIDLVLGDWSGMLRSASIDALVSNPPYLTESEYAGLDGSVRDWEPRSALPSGEDGLADTRRVLTEGVRVVRPGGWVALELDSQRADASAALARAAGYEEVTVQDDLFGRARYLFARRSDR